jgi:hypothetical protein
MLIAKIEGSTVLEVADYRAIFPDVSFTEAGPDLAWLKENSCLPVTVWKAYNAETQVLEPCTPYIDGDTVYTVDVVDLTPEQIAEKQAAELLAKRQAMIVTPYQAKVVLLDAGQLDEVEAAVAASTDPKVKLAWTNAIQYQRLSPLVEEMQKAIGWSDADLDLLFEAAQKIV